MLSDQKPTEKIAIIDFDGTLCKFAFPDVGPIEPGVLYALTLLRQKGYKIKIHSCRTATYWGRDDEREKHIQLINEFLNVHHLPYDELIITSNMDKPIGDVYIDDRAIHYDNNWRQIADTL